MPTYQLFSPLAVGPAIDTIPELRGAGVVVMEDRMCRVTRPSEHHSGFATWVVIEEMDAGDEPRAADGSPKPTLGKELLGTTISCGGAVLAGIAATGAAAVAPATAGASLIVATASAGAALASAAQCGLSVGRVLNELFAPRANQDLDSSAWYARTSVTLDAIVVVGAVASLGQSAQGVARLLEAQKLRGGTTLGLLKGMNRVARKQLAVDMAKYMGRASTRRQFIRASRQGLIPKVWQQKHLNQFFLNRVAQTVSDGLALEQGYDTFGRPLTLQIEQEN